MLSHQSNLRIFQLFGDRIQQLYSLLSYLYGHHYFSLNKLHEEMSRASEVHAVPVAKHIQLDFIVSDIDDQIRGGIWNVSEPHRKFC